MKILRFNCTNYCQHAGEHEWKFTGRLIGILGSNGQGKSNLIRGIHGALTGEFERPRPRLLTFGTDKGQIGLEFEVSPGLIATVTRDLHREKTVLSFSGPEGEQRSKITGARDVNKAILELLETEKTLLDSIIFVRQDELASLLFTSPTENARLAGKFFGLERCVTIEKSLSEKLAQIQFLPVPGDPVKLRGELAELQVVRQHLDVQVGAALPPLPSAEAERLRGELAAFAAARETWAVVERYNARQEDIDYRLQTARLEHDAATDGIAKINPETLREFYVREAEKRRLHESRRVVLNRRDALKKEQSALEQQLSRQVVMTDAELEVARTRLRELDSLESGDDLIRKKQDDLLARVQARDGESCPVCLKPARWVEEEIQPILDDQARPRQNEAVLDEIRRLLVVISGTENIREEQTRKRHAMADAIQRCEAESAALGEDQGEGEPERWEKALKTYDDMRERQSRLAHDIQRLEKELAALPLPPAAVGVPPGFDPAAVQAQLDESAGRERQALELRHERARVSTQLESKEAELAAVEKVVADNAAAAAHRETLLRLRRTFHPDGAPAELIGRRVARMEPRINEYLAALAMPFRARALSGFNFEFVFAGQEAYPRMAAELSGGERTATSVAFRLAALSSFGASVGLLALDEASQGLNQARIALFATLLENLKPLAEALHLTCLFITHEDALRPSFEQIIEL